MNSRPRDVITVRFLLRRGLLDTTMTETVLLHLHIIVNIIAILYHKRRYNFSRSLIFIQCHFYVEKNWFLYRKDKNSYSSSQRNDFTSCFLSTNSYFLQLYCGVLYCYRGQHITLLLCWHKLWSPLNGVDGLATVPLIYYIVQWLEDAKIFGLDRYHTMLPNLKFYKSVTPLQDSSTSHHVIVSAFL